MLADPQVLWQVWGRAVDLLWDWREAGGDTERNYIYIWSWEQRWQELSAGGTTARNTVLAP